MQITGLLGKSVDKGNAILKLSRTSRDRPLQARRLDRDVTGARGVMADRTVLIIYSIFEKKNKLKK